MLPQRASNSRHGLEHLAPQRFAVALGQSRVADGVRADAPALLAQGPQLVPAHEVEVRTHGARVVMRQSLVGPDQSGAHEGARRYVMLGEDRPGDVPHAPVAVPGMIESDALVPCHVGEEQGDVGRFRRWDAAWVAQQPLRHFLHDLGHLAWLFRHGWLLSHYGDTLLFMFPIPGP